MRSLRLFRTHATSYSANEFLKSFPNLENLHLNMHDLLKTSEIPCLFSLVRLTELCLQSVELSSENVASFAGFRSLNTLRLYKCTIASDFFELGQALAQTPLKSIVFWQMLLNPENLESFLQAIDIPHLAVTLARNFDVLKRFASAPRTHPVSFFISRTSWH